MIAETLVAFSPRVAFLFGMAASQAKLTPLLFPRKCDSLLRAQACEFLAEIQRVILLAHWAWRRTTHAPSLP